MDIRDATTDDVDFIAWVMLAASRSHLPRGLWEYIYDWDESTTLEFLRRLAVTDDVHVFHHSLFVIASVDDIPAAAMCGYEADTQGIAVAMPSIGTIGMELGMTMDDAFMRRATAVGAVTPEVAEGSWVVENVATRPEFRRRGLTQALLEHVLDRGRSRDLALSQIAVFLGNSPAREAYIRAGYELKDERRDAVFEADMGCPGVERLVMTL